MGETQCGFKLDGEGRPRENDILQNWHLLHQAIEHFKGEHEKMSPSISEAKSEVETAPVPVGLADSDSEKPMTSPAAEPSSKQNQQNADTTVINEEKKKDPEKEAEEKNEEFMAEEVDSTNLSEHSRTENTVPIIIEPVETNNEYLNRELVNEDSPLKRRISFTSILPTKIIEIPSKEETKAAEAATEDDPGNRNSEAPVVYVLKKQKKRVTTDEETSKTDQKNAAITLANQAWFGTAQPGKTNEEICKDLEEAENCAEAEVDDDEVLEEDEVGQGHEGEEGLQAAADDTTLLEMEATENNQNQAEEEMPEADDHERDGQGTVSEMSSLPTYELSPQPMNPTLSEPTPLSSILPNVFLNAPLTIENPNSDNLLGSLHASANSGSEGVDSSPANENLTGDEHSGETPEQGDETYGAIRRVSGYSGENDEEEEYDDHNDDDKSEEILQFTHENEVDPKATHHESTTTTTLAHAQTAIESSSPTPSQQQAIEAAALADVADTSPPLPNQPETVNNTTQSVSQISRTPSSQVDLGGAAISAALTERQSIDQAPQSVPEISSSLPEQPINLLQTVQSADLTSPPQITSQTADTASPPSLVFGATAVEFNQPLFFSPNFGTQVMDPIGHRRQDNFTGKQSHHPNFSVYNELRNFLIPDGGTVPEVTDTVMGRITGVLDSEGGQNPGEHQQEQQREEPEQSPPSLEVEEEFEQTPRSRNPPEDQQ